MYSNGEAARGPNTAAAHSLCLDHAETALTTRTIDSRGADTLETGARIPFVDAAPPTDGLQAWLLRLSLVLLWSLILLLSWVPSASSQEPDEEKADNGVLDMSLEDLLNVEVTSVSKKSEKRTAAAAAIFVLTQEDIRRSGATTIPDLLRTVPGIQVAQIDSSRWSVTARGFSGRFANKLLVLIDGRSIYTPFFSGVHWEANDVVLEDVDRIEIIRGPGGTLWGANAVNGVINIVTKTAEDTQGGLVSGKLGTEQRASTTLRYGGKLREVGHYRAYAKYFYHDEGGSFIEDDVGPTGGDANDDWHSGLGGFRMDLDVSPDDVLTLQGDLHVLSLNGTYDLPFFTDPLFVRTDVTNNYQSGNLVARWTRRLADDSEIQLQGFWDYYHFDEVPLEERRHTLDLDFQHRFQAGTRHDILWGLGYRVTMDDFDNTEFASMDPDHETDHVFSAFMQDEIELLETLQLTLGTKIEHNDYTGFEIQPSARFAWTPNERHTLWGAVSRAVRTPSRSENAVRLNLGEANGFPGLFVSAFGNSDFKSEELLAFELGYRVVPNDRIALDVVLFHNDYDNVRSIRVDDPIAEDDPPPPHQLVPAVLTNGANVETYGVELGADLSIKPWWLIRASYTHMEINGSNLFASTGAEETPSNQFSLQNRFDLPHNLEFDTTLRYVDSLRTLNIDSYLEMDMRFAWRPREDLEIAIVGQNLLDSAHEEYDDTILLSVPTEVQRGVYGKITWRF